MQEVRGGVSFAQAAAASWKTLAFFALQASKLEPLSCSHLGLINREHLEDEG